MADYYNLNNILNKKDIEGNTPSVFIITNNRSAGKTTACLLKIIENFKERNEKFVLLYRNRYETRISDVIFEDVLSMYYPDDKVSLKVTGEILINLYLNECPFGFAICIKDFNKLKKYSPMFKDVSFVFFDEYQPEDGAYLKNEVKMVFSIMRTVARGGGARSRDVKLVLSGNPVSVINPWYIHYQIYKRLKIDTKLIRGEGWIAEFAINEEAKKELSESTLTRAFNSEDDKKSITGTYLYDTSDFIQKPTGKSKYMFTLVKDNNKYGVYEFFEKGFIYVSKKVQGNYPLILCFEPNDHQQNTLLISHYSPIFKELKKAFQLGALKFDSGEAKLAIYDILGMTMY